MLNIIAFGFLWRVLGGMFSDADGNNRVPRYVSLPIVFGIIALQLSSIPLLLAYSYLFAVLRLLSTRPLLDANRNISGAIPKGIIRNLAIIPALPFTSYFYIIFLAQPCLYWLIGRIRTKYPLFNSIAISEIVSGFLYGLLLPIR